MKLAKLLLLSVAFVGFHHTAWGQDAVQEPSVGNTDVSAGILGYLDPKTGAFKPVAQAGEAPALGFTTVNGEFEFKISVTIKSSISTTTSLLCESHVSTFDTGGGVSHTETAIVAASRSGSTATCTVVIPYAWALATASTDSVSLDYSVIAGSATTPSRISTHTLAPIKVPANGMTTVETVAVTI